MATITFYEKPGCANNTKQKALLAAAGHTVIARNLLTEPWTEERLLEFFGNHSVAEWFNRAAPRVKSGELVPELLDEAEALQLMLDDPLLIRRPLIEADGRRDIGFNQEKYRHGWRWHLPGATWKAARVHISRALAISCKADGGRQRGSYVSLPGQ